jgi:hypothetical protein
MHTFAPTEGLTPSAGSVTKVVAPKARFRHYPVKVHRNRESFPRIDQIDEFQGARADHWRGTDGETRMGSLDGLSTPPPQPLLPPLPLGTTTLPRSF